MTFTSNYIQVVASYEQESQLALWGPTNVSWYKLLSFGNVFWASILFTKPISARWLQILQYDVSTRHNTY